MKLNVQADQFSRGSKYTAKSIGVNVYGNNKREDSDKVVNSYPMLKRSIIGEIIFGREGTL